MRGLLLGMIVMATVPAYAAPDELLGRPLVLPAGELDVRLTMEANLEATQLGRPLSIAPDVWWGMLPRWTIGVIHSDTSLDQIGSGASFCVRESDVPPCERWYQGGGVDVLFSALEGALAVAPRVRMLVRDFHPWKPATTLGAQVRWASGRFAISSDPYVRLPLANAPRGNRSAILVPVWLALQPATGWLVTVGTSYGGDLVVLRDDERIALAAAAQAQVTPALALGVELGWPALFGPQHDAGHGTLMVTTDWRR